MRLALLFPPFGSITHPYLSLPSLSAYLRSLGHDVFQFDLGMQALDLMLAPAYLQSIGETISSRIDSLQNRRNLNKKARKHLRAVRRAQLFALETTDNIDIAKSILRSKRDFYDVDKYRFATNVIRRAFEMISAAHFPTKFSFNNIKYGNDRHLLGIYELSYDDERNPFLTTLRDSVLPLCLPQVPPVVGISVTYYHQLTSGFTLARLIKETSPHTHIVMGGATVTSAEKRLKEAPDAFKWVDSYVFGEGETAFGVLLDSIVSNKSPAISSDRLFMNGKNRFLGDMRPTIDRPSERERFDQLPSPDYSGLNLSQFLVSRNHVSCLKRPRLLLQQVQLL